MACSRLVESAAQRKSETLLPSPLAELLMLVPKSNYSSMSLQAVPSSASLTAEEAAGSTMPSVPVGNFKYGADFFNHSRSSSRSWTPFFISPLFKTGSGGRECSHHKIRLAFSRIQVLGLKISFLEEERFYF